MPQTRATTARQACGVQEPLDDENWIADGWMQAKDGRRGKIIDVIIHHRKVKLEGRTGLGDESAADTDLNYADLR